MLLQKSPRKNGGFEFSSDQILSGDPNVVCSPPTGMTMMAISNSRILGIYLQVDRVKAHSGEPAVAAIGPFCVQFV